MRLLPHSILPLLPRIPLPPRLPLSPPFPQIFSPGFASLPTLLACALNYLQRDCLISIPSLNFYAQISVSIAFFFYLVVIETVTTSPVKITVATTKLGKEVFTDDGEFIYIKLRRLCFFLLVVIVLTCYF